MEAEFLPIEDLGGQDVAHGFLQDPLGHAVPDFQVVGQAERQFDHRMVQEWNTPLDRRRHRHLVDAHQQQLRQAVHQFEIGAAPREIIRRQDSLRFGIESIDDGGWRVVATQEVGAEQGRQLVVV
ncbi:MAG: hypothetical protein FD129_995, partial [bacterium]